MKSLVKPTTPIMLQLNHGEEVAPNRPSVVTPSSFVMSRIAGGVLRLIAADLPDEATDAGFRAHWKACLKDGKVDEAFAVESYLATFKKEEETEEETAARLLAEAEAEAEAEAAATPRQDKKNHGKK